jgi:hypothetical protein
VRVGAGAGCGGTANGGWGGEGKCEVARYDVLFLVQTGRDDLFVSREDVRKVTRASKWKEGLT